MNDQVIAATYVTAIVLLLIGAGVNLAYVATRQRRANKKRIYLIYALIMLYLAMVYSLALSGADWYVLRSGLLTRIGIIAVALLSPINAIADWRIEK